MLFGLESMEEGFVLIAPDGRKYALSEDQLICKVHELDRVPGGNDGRVQPGQKSQAEINPVPQSSDSSALGKRGPEDMFLHSLDAKNSAKGTMTARVLKEAKTQIDITGKINASKIAAMLSLSSATISYHLQKVEKEIEAHKAQHEESKFKPKLRTDTHVPEEEKHLEQLH